MSFRKYLVVALLAMFAGAAVAGTTPEGLEYLNANKLKEGVTELPSGLQYRVLKEGPAGVSTRCACHYRGTTIDGKEFDSSYSRGQPTTFAPNQVIKGWTEAMQLMKEGDKWELVIPSELAYGDRQMGADITPGAVLVFTLEMIKVGA
jgi:FKBP-type peptidyl-prolyl cis-trans isomerase FklB